MNVMITFTSATLLSNDSQVCRVKKFCFEPKDVILAHVRSYSIDLLVLLVWYVVMWEYFTCACQLTAPAI